MVTEGAGRTQVRPQSLVGHPAGPGPGPEHPQLHASHRARQPRRLHGQLAQPAVPPQGAHVRHARLGVARPSPRAQRRYCPRHLALHTNQTRPPQTACDRAHRLRLRHGRRDLLAVHLHGAGGPSRLGGGDGMKSHSSLPTGARASCSQCTTANSVSTSFSLRAKSKSLLPTPPLPPLLLSRQRGGAGAADRPTDQSDTRLDTSTR